MSDFHHPRRSLFKRGVPIVFSSPKAICYPDKLFSRARAEDFGSRRGPTDEHRSLIGQPSRGTGSGRFGAEEYEQSIA